MRARLIPWYGADRWSDGERRSEHKPGKAKCGYSTEHRALFSSLRRQSGRTGSQKEPVRTWSVLALADFDFQRLKSIGCVAAHEDPEGSALKLPAAVVVGE
jgi:hypothetical protein